MGKLTALGLLRAHVPNMNAPNIYTLSAAGGRYLEAVGVDPAEIFIGGAIADIDPHLIALNNFRLALVLATRVRRDVRVDLFLADHDLRRSAGRGRPGYIPDALVRLVHELHTPVGLVVEIDAGTESTAQFAAKVRVTVELWERGLPVWGLAPWRPVLIAPSGGRIRTLARTIDEGGRSELWLAGEQPRVCSDPLGPAFASVAELLREAKDASPVYPGRLVPPPGEVR
jgi:hypothetical protein